MESLRRVRGIIGRGRAVFVSGPQYARPSAAASRQLFAAAASSAESSSPNETESQLLSVSKQFDGALAKRNISDLRATLAEGVILHHDGFTLGSDLKGSEVVDYFRKYFDKYDFDHTAIAGAVDSGDRSAFSFWCDQGVKAKGSSGQGEDTVGMWHHVMNGDHKISHTWFLRQMTKDEVDRKMQHPTGQLSLPDPLHWAESAQSQQHDEQRCHAQDKAARVFNEMWRTGDTSKVDDIMTKNFKIYDPVMGSTVEGTDGFKKHIQSMHEACRIEDQQYRIACTHGDKAFIWWKNSTAPSDGMSDDQMYGLNMLVFDDDCKISSVVGFRQPTVKESHKLVKEEVQRDIKERV